jgi:hypothetical protein
MFNVNCLSEKGIEEELVFKLKDQSWNFLRNCRTESGLYRLTPNSETSPFALCFAIFLYQLIGRLHELESEFSYLAEQVATDLYSYAEKRKKMADLKTDKAFLQLLAFSLSTLHLLEAREQYPLTDIVESLVPDDMQAYLEEVRAYDGVPRSGNLAMCMGVLVIYGRNFLGMSFDNQIETWVNGHLTHMNQYGYWGDESITHLQFQNGYHQYEILEYLGLENPSIESAVAFVRQIADSRGQFAPYFGGSGCYDYDAVSIITSPDRMLTDTDIKLLSVTVGTILSEQNQDGGFSESQWIRPRSSRSIIAGIRHVLSAKNALRKERARYFLALLSPKHDRLNTHWTSYSRHWSESDLWDTWFRLLTLARIDCAINPVNHDRWGFIDFPGIGYCAR